MRATIVLGTAKCSQHDASEPLSREITEITMIRYQKRQPIIASKQRLTRQARNLKYTTRSPPAKCKSTQKRARPQILRTCRPSTQKHTNTVKCNSIFWRDLSQRECVGNVVECAWHGWKEEATARVQRCQVCAPINTHPQLELSLRSSWLRRSPLLS